MKKKKKELNNNKMIMTLIVIFMLIIAISTYWIYAYNHKHPYLDDNPVSFKVSNYAEIKGNLVYLKNIDDKISEAFLLKQNNIINNNNIVDIKINKTIWNSILSIKISYIIKKDNSNYEEVITENINLKNNEYVTNEYLLEQSGTSYIELAEDIFNDYIKLDISKDNIVVDAISEEKMTYEEFNNNSYKYIVRIRELLPKIIKIYIEDGKLMYSVKLKNIKEVCYLTSDKDPDVNINKEIGKL